MFRTVKRIIDWCGEFKGKLYAGFVFSFFSTWFAALPTMVAAYTVGILIESERTGTVFDGKWIWISALLILGLILLRFMFDYLRARCQESISYELAARDRLAIGEALKRVSLGYFQQVDTGNILNSITTGLHSLENMGMRMLDTFVGGYLNFLCIFLFLLFFSPLVCLIALAGAAVSFLFLLLVSRHSVKNAPVSAQAGRELTAAVLEYARGLPVVKSFGQDGASMAAVRKAFRDSRDICLKIEWGYTPANCLHLLALKTASVCMAAASCWLCFTGAMSFSYMLVFVFFSFSILSGLESISDSAHVLGVIDTTMDQLDALKEGNYIDRDGKEVSLSNYDIEFRNVDFSYEIEKATSGSSERGKLQEEKVQERKVLKNVSFTIPERKFTAIVGPSGSGKTTICSLIARFYDVRKGSILIGGHDVREFTCDSLLNNISMVFQNVYFEFIQALSDGYDTVIGEGGDTLSGGEKQRISIARAILKDAPVIILDEATASIDPENEHLIQGAITELTRGKTVISIAHRLATIENADQILVVDDGRIVQRGTHDVLVKEEGLYRRFVQVRQKAEGWKMGSE